jgi:hypothetical protein
MAQKTIYLPATDVAIWDRVQTECDQSISSIVMDCLKRRIKAVERIRVDLYADGDSAAERRKVAFSGRWLAGSVASGVKREETDDTGLLADSTCEYSLARTAKGKLAVYGSSNAFQFLEVYDSWDELQGAKSLSSFAIVVAPGARGKVLYPASVLAVFEEAIKDEDVEELHI